MILSTDTVMLRKLQAIQRSVTVMNWAGTVGASRSCRSTSGKTNDKIRTLGHVQPHQDLVKSRRSITEASGRTHQGAVKGTMYITKTYLP